MLFLKNQENNPDFLNYYLKYTKFISLYSETTVNEIYSDLKTFFRFLIYKNETNSKNKFDLNAFQQISIKNFTIDNLKKVDGMIINEFIFFLNNKLGNSPKTRNRKIASLKHFFKYLSNNNLIVSNPTQNIKRISVEKRLPKHLNLNESKKLLSITLNSNNRNAIRNYAIECVFLNCCLRLSELVMINITDLKLDDKTLKVKGKGNKERIIYLNEAVEEAIKEYLKIRPNLSNTDPNYDALFLSERKKRISRRNVQLIIEQALKKTINNPYHNYHTHSLRHTGATLMYDTKDSNILVIQKILGHKNLTSTEIYTHVSSKKMKYIMENCTISSILEKRKEMSNE